MEIFIIALVALIASVLTFFSGFGLGTILLPAFSLFFPLEIAVGLTAIVHFLNNVFKFALIGKQVDWKVALRFGLPAILAAYFGASLLMSLSAGHVLYEYDLGRRHCEVTIINVVIALLMILFALMDIIPAFNKIQFGEKSLPWGGLLSGFFGGLSGHQGALRSMFLIQLGLTKEAFVATGVMIAMLIDTVRIGVYAMEQNFGFVSDNLQPLLAAVIAAFVGAILGKRLLKKITIETVHYVVAIMIITLSLLLGAGII